MSVYGWIIVCIMAGPVALSFDRKIAFYKHFAPLFLAVLLVGTPFLIWDHLFTLWGVWGFTEKYLFGYYLSDLPIEEVLFFLAAPYSLVFIFEVLKGYFPNFNAHWPTFLVVMLIGSLSITFLILFPTSFYSVSASGLAIVLLLFYRYLFKWKWMPYFSLAYLIGLIPFLFINGWLTGSFTDDPIVWYNEKHFSSWRILTIPVEDFVYNFDLILLVVITYEHLRFSPNKNIIRLRKTWGQ